ncbi:CDP-diacylglycerol diphosphatase [Edwardsiella hoshinae]|uniref:CDP-diacylglycerol pyrophosphatase n=1 Tax=Edwardsiella hoshinae TaxID=93378 RepID=A0A376D6E9_9GAMM|nr:CDP-diacylglycerol diphosphatase [Edwardsiella hoshinae]QPR28566.1 CDP-diacylglycerol diphosphatase [Edwardsiella hoshinae]STC82808.1 CDP-diacylglycerol pyrophosphatase [Edwardsiella hoshinae]
MSIRRRYHCALILFIVVLPLAGVLILLYRPQSDALWRIVSQQCLPHQRTTGVATPCVRLNPQQGYLLLKYRNPSCISLIFIVFTFFDVKTYN